MASLCKLSEMIVENLRVKMEQESNLTIRGSSFISNFHKRKSALWGQLLLKVIRLNNFFFTCFSLI